MALNERRADEYIKDMLESITLIQQFISSADESAFHAQKLVQHAIIWHFAILGEAASRLPTTVRQQYSSVPWRQIINMRNRLIHNYYQIDLAIVWRAIQDDLPILEPQLQTMLANIERDAQL